MILIVSLNLAIDKVLYIDELKLFKENRVKVLSALPGGKGVNVARALKSFSKISTVSGFKGGFNGKFIEENLKKEGILSLLYEINSENRICNIFVDKYSNVTEIYEIGPNIEEDDFYGLLDEINKRCESFQYIVISGSFPQGIKEKNILDLLKIFKDRKIFLDIHGEILLKIVKQFEIFFVKINEKEFRNTFDCGEDILKCLSEVSKNLKTLVFVVTLEDKGAIFSYNRKIYKIYSKYKVKPVNPVGAGDSFMGSFVHGIDEGMSVFDSLKYGISASVSNVTLLEGGKVNFNIFFDILKNTYIKEV
ncbi:MAG: 1-phosphofructokinase family hexose kinase [Caldisericia bacterium]